MGLPLNNYWGDPEHIGGHTEGGGGFIQLWPSTPHTFKRIFLFVNDIHMFIGGFIYSVSYAEISFESFHELTASRNSVLLYYVLLDSSQGQAFLTAGSTSLLVWVHSSHLLLFNGTRQRWKPFRHPLVFSYALVSSVLLCFAGCIIMKVLIASQQPQTVS